ncbi:MAG: C_GCAxxG_C_C family protein [Desulfobacterales bacterium]|nr:C-GCAxxG-C-C family protein [Deltaproteobacteria bacterium]NNK96680.1 C_GCAxxG_C_C family protein [Desulfobacterales bacterium]
MPSGDFVTTRVHHYYHHNDHNCAVTTLKILAEKFAINLHDQVLDAALGMHGAGGLRAQCGLVEGALLFMPIYGKTRNQADEQIVAWCKQFADDFEENFDSLQCRELRPQGFTPDNPPHLCEKLTCRANEFAITFMLTQISANK